MTRRKTGLQRPFNSMQIMTWILLPFLIIQFLVCISPVLPVAASVPLTIIFVLLGMSSAYFGYKSCSIDPIDPRLLSSQNEDYTNVDSETKYCWVCETRVGVKSMHCKFCNKCVDVFDHHCQWLNTCVGKKNYKYFYRTVVSITLFTVMHTMVSWTEVFLYFFNVGNIKEKSDKLYGVNQSVLIYVVIGVGIITISSTVLVGQLWLFHLTLQKKEMTTYAFIVQDNLKRRERFAQNIALQRRRVIEKNNAREQGKKWRYFRLSVGGKLRPCDAYCCFPCDPLSNEDNHEEPNQGQSSESAENGERTRGEKEHTDITESSETKETQNIPTPLSDTRTTSPKGPVMIPVSSPQQSKPHIESSNDIYEGSDKSDDLIQDRNQKIGGKGKDVVEIDGKEEAISYGQDLNIASKDKDHQTEQSKEYRRTPPPPSGDQNYVPRSAHQVDEIV